MYEEITQKEKAILHIKEVFQTDIARCGATLMIEQPCTLNLFFHKYYKAGILYKGQQISARVRWFQTGNFQILRMQGTGASELLNDVYSMQCNERRFSIAARQFLRHLAHVSLVPLSALSLAYFVAGQVSHGFITACIACYIRVIWGLSRTML